ncbi:MAG: MipA/OmpV family protein [Pseudomonadota bacterium]
MTHMIRVVLLLGLAGSYALATPAVAQDTAVTDSSAPASDVGSGLTIGLGGAYLPDYEGSDDYRLVPGPVAIGSVSGFSFTLAGNRLSVDMIPNKSGPTWDIQAGPIGVLNLNRTSRKSIDNVRVKALDELDMGIEAGGFVGIGKTGLITSDFDKLSVSISYRKDVAGASKGSVWQPSINYLTPLSRKAAIALFASAERVSDRYARYYFSVSPSDSLLSGLPAYSAEGGTKSYTLGALATVALTGDLLHGAKLVAGGTYKRLQGNIADSPIVSIAGDRTQWLGAIGLAYTF